MGNEITRLDLELQDLYSQFQKMLLDSFGSDINGHLSIYENGHGIKPLKWLDGKLFVYGKPYLEASLIERCYATKYVPDFLNILLLKQKDLIVRIESAISILRSYLELPESSKSDL